MYKKCFKRIIDVALSAVGIVCLVLPMAVVALITVIDSPGPVFFKQKRYGLNKEIYTIIKFRSMPTHVPSDIPTHLFNSEDMLSKWQKFIRKTSIDEFPQLFNIFMGDMSIVGPRPAILTLTELVDERDKYGANGVKPGLTGWAQINGRDEISNEEKAEMDGYYANNLSFKLDCKCFFRTIPYVLRRDGVVEGGTGKINRQN